MALVINDRVKETTATTGTGTITFEGAETGFETFAAGIGNNNTTYYCIVLNDEFEIGLGTLSADSSTMARTTIISSSNSDSAVNFSAGNKFVFCTLPASKAAVLDASGNLTVSSIIINGANIGHTSDTDAIAISSGGVVTFSQRDIHSGGITIANGGQIGSASDTDAISIASGGAVTFSQRDVHSAGITIADGGQIGSASTLDAMVVNSSGDVTFKNDATVTNDLTVTGDFTVNGDTTTINTTNKVLTDAIIELANGTTGTPTNDAGMVIERGDQNNAFIGFDESADKFIVGTGTFTGASTGNLSITTGTLVASLEAATVTASGIIKTDDTTNATSTTDGSLQTDGGLSVVLDAVFGDDVKLLSDASVLSFGANSEITLTHVHDTGLLLEDSGGTPTLQFHDANESIASDGSKLILKSNNVTFNMPTADGSDGHFLKTNGSGTLSFAAASASSLACDDLTEGDAAVLISTSSGNITIDATANNSDIIFKGTDGGSDTTFLTLDGSEAGAAAFNGAITANAGVIVDNITIDGTEIDLSSGDLTLDVAGDIILDAGGEEVIFKDGSTNVGHVSLDSDNLTIKSLVSDKDMIFKGNDGGSEITALTLDMSAAGAATFNNDVTAFSDERLKSDIETITNALDKVMEMRGVTFTREGRQGTGVIAQEMQKVMPEVVHDENEYMSVAYGNLVGVLIEAVKELKAEVDELKNRR